MDFDHNVVTTSPQETTRLGQELGDQLKKVHSAQCTVVCLYGELGSGKTTFVQGFAKTFGITTRLLSPTFIIVRRYLLIARPGFLYHIDLYRLESEKDLQKLGMPEILADPDSIVLIEWAEKLKHLLPKARIDVQFSLLEDGKHRISQCKTS